MTIYNITTGRSRLETEWKARSLSWEELTRKLTKVKRTSESMAEYKVMTKAQRGRVKDIGGFVGGTLAGTRRKATEVTGRSLVTLDIDFGTASTPDVISDMLAGTQWCLYTTHSHTPKEPRYRLVVPLSREVTPDEYGPIARRIADDIDITLFDQSTYEPSRLMYWPSAPRDAEFIGLTGEGAPADADALLATYTDWRNVAEWPMHETHASKGSRQEDPRTKPGIIGAFCRTYGIAEAIATFLPGVYTQTAQEDRWTYAEGSTHGGMVTYDDTWAYSHHGTDPARGKLCNAFDLVRLHRFTDLDEGVDIENTPVNKIPSFVEMERLARSDKRVAGQRAKERMQELSDEPK